ncbi:uncharacterized protein LOC131659680 [Vicia villosa]|uniref:uncharacterized protein LOC131659680 n=1 Tax=Vicia villosa TaxID=3911 RepID=UPI00273CCCA4|nr:uncharacterized protein LOC131659680 [Vicia villosa]
MEVLTALMRKAEEIGDFWGFKIDVNEEVDLIQFADDIIIILEGDAANLWSMKVIHKGFELMSGLRIHFHKNNIYGINVGDWFLNAASSFLSCKVGSLPFKFLGVKVGGNPRNILMWKDLISFLRKRLAVWRGKNLSIAGRVVLINAVFNAIPIYFYLSTKLRLSGGDPKKMIHWVCWDTVCKSREEGGLGVKNVQIMNVALISKWKWRILTENDAVWCGILKARYGKVKLKVLVGDIPVVGKKDSVW